MSTINIDELAREAYKTQQQVKADAERARDEENKCLKQLQLDQLAKALKNELGDELAEALKTQFQWYQDASNRQPYPAALFDESGERWIVSQSHPNAYQLQDWKWHREIKTFFTSAYGLKTHTDYEPGTLTAHLLADIGALRLTKEEHERTEALRQQARNETAQRRAEAETLEQEQRMAAAARIEAILDDARREAQAGLWRWPKGFSTNVYRVSWCNGAYECEGTDAYFSFDEGWSAQAEGDEFGWWYFQIESYDGPKIRALRLNAEQHRPIPERFTLKSVDDAAVLGLRESVMATARGVRHDGKRLIEDADGMYNFLIDDYIPSQWVREMVDQAAGRAGEGEQPT